MSLVRPVAAAEAGTLPAEDPPLASASQPRKSPLVAAVHILLVRVRFALLLAAVLLLVGYWPTLRNHADRLVHTPQPGDGGGVSSDTEYWCPMCPGVLSDWPSKCPICNMTLVRRTRGEAVPLPDGVLARMQFSPYRIQLAGIRTAAIEYRPLRREAVVVGLARRSSDGAAVEIEADALAADRSLLVVGQPIEATADGLEGHVPFRGKVVRLDPAESVVRILIEDPDRDLRAGIVVTVRCQVTLARVGWWRRAVWDEWQTRTAAESVANALTRSPDASAARVGVLLETAVQQAAFTCGMGIAVPCSAIVDHGSRKLAFVESGPGMFDAVEVAVGPRCGDYYPVLRGVRVGQRVAAAGAFLLDAEMCPAHDLSAAWFGASRPTGSAHQTDAVPRPTAKPGAVPSEEDRRLVEKQKICPVTGEPLDSMGGPVRVEVADRVVFICCKGCTNELRQNPAKYLSKLK